MQMRVHAATAITRRHTGAITARPWTELLAFGPPNTFRISRSPGNRPGQVRFGAQHTRRPSAELRTGRIQGRPYAVQALSTWCCRTAHPPGVGSGAAHRPGPRIGPESSV